MLIESALPEHMDAPPANRSHLIGYA